MVGVLDGIYTIVSCDGEGRRHVVWTDGDRDGIADSTRYMVRDGAVTVLRDEGADGACVLILRATTSETGSTVERDEDCDGVFESSVLGGRLLNGSSC